MGQKVESARIKRALLKTGTQNGMEIKRTSLDLAEDNQIREYVKKKLYVAGVHKVLIGKDPPETKSRVIVLTQAGYGNRQIGDGIEALKKRSCKTYRKRSRNFHRRSEIGA